MVYALSVLLIFGLRVTDVSIGALRVIYMVRGRRLFAACLGFAESGIFILAIAQVFRDLSDPFKMVAYAAGYATGTAVGVTLERWIASGFLLLRIISRDKSGPLLEALREQNIGVTAIEGKGKEGERLILFAVIVRRLGKRVLQLVREVDPEAFVTVDQVTPASGGYLPYTASPASIRK